MVKKGISVLLALLMLTALSACSLFGGGNDNGGGDLSDDLSSGEIELMGTVYTLPCPMSEFLDAGWKLNGDGDINDSEIDGNDYDGFFFFKRSASFYPFICNLESDSLPIKDCYWGGILHDPSDEESGATIRLPGGICLGSTMDDVMDAYGDPSYESDLGDEITWYYEDGDVSLSVDFDEDELVNSINYKVF